MIRIRASRPEDGVVLRDIERSAGEGFRAIGMEAVANEEPRSEVELTAYAMAGRSWVAVEDTDRPVGYILLDEIDGDAHVAQVSVLPEERIGPGLRAAMTHESDGGPRAAARVCMRVDTSVRMIVGG